MTYSGLELTFPIVPIENLKLEFDTTIIEAQEGYERRIPRWTEYRASITIDTLTLTKEELGDLRDFYTTVNGNIGSFKYKNHIEYRVTHDFDIYNTHPNVYSIGMLFPVGSGLYQLVKSYRIGSDFANWVGGYKTIRKVDPETLSIYADGDRVFDFVVDPETGLVEINENVSKATSLTFKAEYYQEMRFNMDTIDATQISPTDYQVSSLSLIEEVETAYSPREVKDWVDFDFEFAFPFEPSNVEKAEFKLSDKSLKNQRNIRKIRDLYLKVLVELESNLLTEQEKGLLITWFCACKGRQLKFQYKELPFRFNVDALSLSSVRLEEDTDLYFKYNTFSLYNRSQEFTALPGVGVVIPEPTIPAFPSSGLVSYWKMDETSGNRLDSVGLHHFVPKSNQVSTVVGVRGNAVALRKDPNQLLSNNTFPQLNTFTNGFSFSLWYRFNSALTSNNFMFILARDGRTTQRSFSIVATSNGKLAQFNLRIGNLSVVSVTSSLDAVVGTWYHLVATYNTANREMKLYHNSILDGVAVHPNGVIQTSTKHLTVGNINETDLDSTVAMNGDVDEIGCWSRVLPQSEINDLYYNGQGIFL